MRTFLCACGATLFFVNDRCLSCGRELGFLPFPGIVSALEPDDTEEGVYVALALGSTRVRKCRNNEAEGVCNWMVSATEDEPFCQACRLNNVIPDLSQPENRARWAEVEKAKRHLIYSLNALGLPIVPKSVDPERGIAFDIMQTTPTTHVVTGHSGGLITLELSEADPVARERMRIAMNERYRTVLGHFRHEIGHYYWDRFFGEAGPELEAFRELFGDERASYQDALTAHYERGPLATWPEAYVSGYATSHPWEDWAESFAHYLHVVDTIETAESFGLARTLPRAPGAPPPTGFEAVMVRWMALTVALNALNRSMGLPDAYPFALSAPARAKLAFVHDAVLRASHAHASERRTAATTGSARPDGMVPAA